jgi:WD40 repeat protein
MNVSLTTLCIVLSSAIAAAGGQTSHLLRFELERKSQDLGLALLLDFGDEIAIYPFGLAPLSRKLPSGAARPTATPDGKFVLWAIQGAPYNSTIETESVTGGTLASQQMDAWVQIIAATAGNPPRIAFISNLTELRYGALKSAASQVIEGMGPISAGAGWSHDGSKLVFGRNGKIQLLDVAKRSVAVIDMGDDPTWSPNGRWIAYRSGESRAILCDSKSLKKRFVLEDHHLAPLPLKWSPDSEYLAFVERGTKDPSQWHLSVFRVVDNSITDVTTFDRIRQYIENWSWIVNYDKFSKQHSLR